MDTRQDTLEAEVTQLKLDLKRQRWTNRLLLALGLVVAGTMSARTQDITPPAPQDLVVRSLKVVGGDGSERITLIGGKEFGRLTMVNRDQKSNIILGGNPVGGFLQVRNSAGEPSVVVSSERPTAGKIVLFTKSKKKGVTMMELVADEENGSITVLDDDGNLLFDMVKGATKDRQVPKR